MPLIFVGPRHVKYGLLTNYILYNFNFLTQKNKLKKSRWKVTSSKLIIFSNISVRYETKGYYKKLEININLVY